MISANIPPSLTRSIKMKIPDRFTDDNCNGRRIPLLLITEWPVQEPIYFSPTVGSGQSSIQNAAKAHINGHARIFVNVPLSLTESGKMERPDRFTDDDSSNRGYLGC